PDTAELTRALTQLQQRSNGAITIAEIGRSNENRPVWSARVGHGPLRLLYITQQHGNEPLGTPAALEFLRQTGIGNTPWQRRLRSQITVDIIVRANPDGTERNWRYNYAPHADPEHGNPGQGYDINRYHDPDVAPDDNPATEAGHIQRHHADYDPHITVDYHMQGRYIDDNGDEITASLLWPTHPDTTTDATTLSQQVTVTAHRAMTRAGGNVSLYPGGDYRGIARNAYGLLGDGSVLIELSAMGPQHEQAQIRSALAAMTAIATTAATGDLDDIDPADADTIPPRGQPIPANAARTTSTDALD
ncbi:M14 family zinc carboxypeptidase, partial [Marinitenerispora sediminis]|uniref:M14 family zinc carboxypeptidase n=2 Tax=Marinitenerispora sediminis TaxID=1931232 RepID=UPI000DF14F29